MELIIKYVAKYLHKSSSLIITIVIFTKFILQCTTLIAACFWFGNETFRNQTLVNVPLNFVAKLTI